jgi:hypothetical protein
MTDDIDAEAEALARARYESGLPLLSNVGEEPAPPGTIISEGPERVAELTIALVNDQGPGFRPGRTRPTYEGAAGHRIPTGDYAEDTVPGVTSLEQLLERLLDQLRASR